MFFGYARVSSKDQKLDRQMIELQNFGIEEKNIYFDKQSGKDFNRTNYKLLRSKLKTGDVLVIKSIDRLGRNYDMIIEEWSYITKTINADIVVLDMNLLDTRTDNKNLVGKFIADVVLQILSFVAESERTNLRQRQAEGIKIAKAKGIEFGRPKQILPNNFTECVKDYKSKKISIKEVLSKTQLKRSTFYKFYRIYKDKL